MTEGFMSFGLEEALMEGIQKMGYEEPTPIQLETIPIGLKGSDVLGQAQTGTGKTASFGLPLLQKIEVRKGKPQALVLAPTRELAIQNGRELIHLGEVKKVNVATVYGGSDIRRQINRLKDQPEVIVGTPGRIMDLMRRKVLDVSEIETLVLDEADEMLSMGFIDDIEAIVRQTPDSRQTLLFSATMPKEIERISQEFLKDPIRVQIKMQGLTAETIEQYYTRAKDYEKFDLLTRFIDVQNPNKAIVFVRTKKRADEVTRGLIERGYPAEGLHGDLSQQQRNGVMRAFTKGDVSLLVATDVAARGLDISDVTHVYNYDIPQDPDSYVHRIGRTGRAGKGGMSITFVSGHEMGYLRVIENLIHKKVQGLRPPTPAEAFRGQMKTSVEQVKELTNVEDARPYEQAVDYLVEEYTSEELAMALLHALAKDPNEVQVHISSEKPLNPKRSTSSRRSYHKKNHHRDYERRNDHREYNRHQKNDRNRTNRSNKNDHRGKKDFIIH